jgi:hypothetical protein
LSITPMVSEHRIAKATRLVEGQAVAL